MGRAGGDFGSLRGWGLRGVPRWLHGGQDICGDLLALLGLQHLPVVPEPGDCPLHHGHRGSGPSGIHPTAPAQAVGLGIRDLLLAECSLARLYHRGGGRGSSRLWLRDLAGLVRRRPGGGLYRLCGQQVCLQFLGNHHVCLLRGGQPRGGFLRPEDGYSGGSGGDGQRLAERRRVPCRDYPEHDWALPSAAGGRVYKSMAYLLGARKL